MRVAKWGNSLAVRLPSDFVKANGLKEGDEIELRAANGLNGYEVAKDDRRARAMRRIAELSVDAPPGFKFDRDEANAR